MYNIRLAFTQRARVTHAAAFVIGSYFLDALYIVKKPRKLSSSAIQFLVDSVPITFLITSAIEDTNYQLECLKEEAKGYFVTFQYLPT
jgi:hypothetical protein